MVFHIPEPIAVCFTSRQMSPLIPYLEAEYCTMYPLEAINAKTPLIDAPPEGGEL